MVVETMMKETILTLAQAAKRVPGPKGCISVATIHRWVKDGVNGRRLEAFTLGGRTMTTLEALARFAQPLDTGSRQDSPPDAVAIVKSRLARPGDGPKHKKAVRLVNNVPVIAKRSTVRELREARAGG